jgi:exo-beta-1,3-glucanase (GH17 family)/cellulose synthase/poly-beta-1,6-N-acetylglucosamine synthase-like glycosyltransferase
MRVFVLAALLAAVIQAGGWYVAKESTQLPAVPDSIDYVSYSPYGRGQDPKDDITFSADHLTRDLDVIASVATGVRTYSTLHGLDALPPLAADAGLNVILGAWIGDTAERDASEIETVVRLAQQNRNVKSLMIGNEVLLRGERTADELIDMIRSVKRQVRVPVSTSEIWYLWLQNPELVKTVDFIAVHVLPYWEGVSAEDAVSYTLGKLQLLRETFPGKRIVLTEFGWPSQGYNYLEADPGAITQARIIRDFLAQAHRLGIEYNIVEAFDQPWKSNEGSVGAYWGLFDADRELKFPLAGPIDDTSIAWKGTAAVVFGLILTVVGMWRRRPTFSHAFAFALVAQAMGAAVAMALAFPFENYVNVGIAVMWAVGFMLVILMAIMTLTKVHEIVEVMLGRSPRRLIDPTTPRPVLTSFPKVSVHVPAYREPPEMLIETLNSLAAMDYPNFEVVVILNNTPDPRHSAPVAAHCRELGDRFVYLDVTCKGFKAGALNIGLEHTDPKAEIIAVIDADYVVDRRWLSDLVPFFNDEQVALVQAPQDHRDHNETPLKHLMNGEYAGFFDIGMVQRNEDNAIIQHGTMCMVRRSALDHVGGWDPSTIVEDTELGLRLYEAGFTAHYTNIRYGRGLLPDTFSAFKTQRFRWAYGAMQLIRKHARQMLPGARALSPEQKVHFVSGWVLWLADALAATAAILNLLWVPVILFVGVVIPTLAFTLPIIAAFAINVAHCVLLYSKRVDVPLRHIPGAAIAAMSVQFTVARAVFTGLIGDSLPFMRTEKGGAGKAGTRNPARWEMIIGGLLLASAATLIVTNTGGVHEMTMFAVILAVQSLPFLCAWFMSLVERFPNGVAFSLRRPLSSAPALGYRPDTGSQQ